MSTYIVLDLEMCRVKKGINYDKFPSNSELIQIGAVALNNNYEIVDTFMTHVKPEFGVIDSYIERLTGITYNDVKNAPNASQALTEFSNWIPDDSILVSWSENDIWQIEDELDFKNIDLPRLYDLLDNFIDCQELFAEKMNDDISYRLSEALIISNIHYDERIHDALVDAQNTALLFKKIQQEDTLVLSPYLITTNNLLNPFSQFCYAT